MIRCTCGAMLTSVEAICESCLPMRKPMRALLEQDYREKCAALEEDLLGWKWRAQSAERARDEAVAALSEARANGLLEAADMCSRFEDCGPSFIAQRLRDSAAALTALRAASQPTGEA